MQHALSNSWPINLATLCYQEFRSDPGYRQPLPKESLRMGIFLTNVMVLEPWRICDEDGKIDSVREWWVAGQQLMNKWWGIGYDTIGLLQGVGAGAVGRNVTPHCLLVAARHRIEIFVLCLPTLEENKRVYICRISFKSSNGQCRVFPQCSIQVRRSSFGLQWRKSKVGAIFPKFSLESWLTIL